MQITVELLKQLGATCEQVQTFAHEWPDGTDVTPESVARAVNLKLDIDWLACRVLKGKALAEYCRVADAAWAAYCQVTDAAWAAYCRVRASALAEYERVRASALAAYKRATAAAFLEAAEAAKGASDEIT